MNLLPTLAFATFLLASGPPLLAQPVGSAHGHRAPAEPALLGLAHLTGVDSAHGHRAPTEPALLGLAHLTGIDSAHTIHVLGCHLGASQASGQWQAAVREAFGLPGGEPADTRLAVFLPEPEPMALHAQNSAAGSSLATHASQSRPSRSGLTPSPLLTAIASSSPRSNADAASSDSSMASLPATLPLGSSRPRFSASSSSSMPPTHPEPRFPSSMLGLDETVAAATAVPSAASSTPPWPHAGAGSFSRSAPALSPSLSQTVSPAPQAIQPRIVGTLRIQEEGPSLVHVIGEGFGKDPHKVKAWCHGFNIPARLINDARVIVSVPMYMADAPIQVSVGNSMATMTPEPMDKDLINKAFHFGPAILPPR